MPITDREFRDVLKFLELKSAEHGGFEQALKEEWDTIQDIASVTSYVEAQDLTRLKTTLQKLDDQRLVVDGEITRLEGRG